MMHDDASERFRIRMPIGVCGVAPLTIVIDHKDNMSPPNLNTFHSVIQMSLSAVCTVYLPSYPRDAMGGRYSRNCIVTSNRYGAKFTRERHEILVSGYVKTKPSER
jgi:hypothetical protein